MIFWRRKDLISGHKKSDLSSYIFYAFILFFILDTSGRVRDSTSPEITELKVTATLNEIQICLQTSCRPLATLYIDGLELSASIKRSRTVVDAILHSVSVCDLNPETIYNKVGVSK